MRKLYIIVLFLALWCYSAFGQFSVYHHNSMSKVFLNNDLSAFDGQETNADTIKAARNEWEAMQIVIKATQDIEDVWILANNDFINAATPETCGQAILVPDI